MAFDAGAIEGRLELNRTPFLEGLRLARQQADEFERKTISPEVELKKAKIEAQITGLEKQLEALSKKKVTPTVEIQTARAQARLTVLRLELEALGRESLPEVERAGVKTKSSIGLLGTAIIALGPAALVAGGVAAGALAPVAVAAAGLAIVALPALKGIHDAALKTGAAQQKALADLGPGAAPAIAAFQLLNAQWHQFRNDLNPAVFGVLTATFALIGQTLPAFTPLIRLMATAVTDLVRGLTPLAPVFGQAFMAMGPIITQFTQGLLHMAQSLASWTQGQGFLHFIQYVVSVGPQLVHTLGSVANVFLQLGIAFAPLLPPMLAIIKAFADVIALVLRLPVVGTAIVGFVVIGVTMWKVASAVKAVEAAWITFGAVFPAIAAGITGGFAGIGAAATALLANPVVLAVAAVAAALYLIVQNWNDVKTQLTDLWRGIIDAYNATIGQLPGMHIAGPGGVGQGQQKINDLLYGDFQKGSTSFGGGDFSPQELTAHPPVLGTGMPTLDGITGTKSKEKPYEGYNPATNKIEFHTSTQWVHIHAVEQKRSHDQMLKQQKAGKTPTAQVPYEGLNPLTGQIEMHTAAEWRHIHTLNAKKNYDKRNAGSSVPFARSGTPQEVTAGGLAGPRSIAHNFADGGITGQSIIYRHSPNYGQARKKDSAEKVASTNERLIKTITHLDETLKKDRVGAKIVIEANPGKRSDHATEIRRRGRQVRQK